MKRLLIHKRESYIVALTLFLWMIISLINSNFALPSFVLDLLSVNSVYFICGLGILPLMIKGDFDLSVGGVIASVSLILVLLVSMIHLPIYILIILGGLLGSFFGMVNGYFIAKYRVSSVIVTLAMMNVHYGFSNYLYRSLHLDQGIVGHYALGSFKFLGLSIENMMTIFMVFLTYYMMRYRPIGRSALAFGGDRQLAKRRGFNHFDTTLKLHSYSGMAAGISAAIYLLTFNQASNDVYGGIEFELIIIVVIGGLNILGGYGSVIGTFTAAVFIVILKSGLVFARIPVFWHDMMIGLIIIMVVSYEMYQYRVKLKQFLVRGDL